MSYLNFFFFFPFLSKRLPNVVFCLIFLLTSCGHKLELPKDPLPIPKVVPNCPVKVALVLGGGGARGMAHVGVLEVFEEKNIKVDLIVGCSAGSIVGALYADYPCAQHVRQALKPLKKWDILDFSFWHSRYGLVQGHSLRKFLSKNLKSRYFHQLQIPLYVVATDLMVGDVIPIARGPIIPAIHASAAVPFVFAPVQIYRRLLVDGAVADPVPVRTAREIGANLIIAVDLSELLPKSCPNNLFGIAERSAEIKFLLHSTSCMAGADVVIRPELGDIGLFDDTHLEHVYQAGRQAALKALPEIYQLMAEKGLLEGQCPQNVSPRPPLERTEESIKGSFRDY